jgi:hypothetical protein
MLISGVALCVLGVLGTAGVTLRVWDNGGNAEDDVARVWVDGGSLGAITVHPGGTNERTWDLGMPSAGTHTLVIEFIEDVDATTLCDEHVGTFGIAFGGGGLAAADDNASATRGSSVDIDVLENDVYVQAGSTATDNIPCPSESPAPGGGCSCADPRTTYQTTFTVSGGSLTVDRIVSPPSKGTAQIVGDRIRYTPNLDGCGVDTFTYEADGPGASSDTATVTVTISSPPPSALDDHAETPEAEPVLIDVLSNDVDSSGGTLSINSVGTPSQGTATIAGDRIRYTPRLRFEGIDRFTYTVRDPCGATASATVEVRVEHANHPPTAHAGAGYRGFTGEPIRLDASFSSDPDIEDTLEYRWDLDDDGRFDTGWLRDAVYAAVFDAPIVGRVAVEVRDLYRGQPTGTTAQATALLRIEPRPPELRGVLFVDLDADGQPNEDDPPLPKIPLVLDGDTIALTGDDGTASFVNLDAGEHTIAVAPDGLALLQLQGFGIDLEEPSITLDVIAGTPSIALFPVRSVVGSLSGFVFVDTDGSGEQEQDEPVVPGLTVSLGEGLERTTDDGGRFLFMNVPAGDYSLTIASERNSWEEPIRVEAGEETELIVAWPSPDSGFLELKIQLDRPGKEGSD